MRDAKFDKKEYAIRFVKCLSALEYLPQLFSHKTEGPNEVWMFQARKLPLARII